MSQHLVFANCIPLVLKFFNQNISSYVSAKNTYAQALSYFFVSSYFYYYYFVSTKLLYVEPG